MIIRRFKEEDAEAVSALIRKTLRISNAPDYPEDILKELILRHTPEYMLERAGWTHFYVADEDDGVKESIIGCGAIGPYWDREDESALFTIFVLPEFQRKGVGRAIVEALEQDEYALRANRIEIAASITGLSFYRKLGYDYKNGHAELDEERLYRLEKYPAARPSGLLRDCITGCDSGSISDFDSDSICDSISGGNASTLDYYNAHAEAFIEGTIHANMQEARERFLSYVPEGGRILDAGCGSGRDTEAFLRAGYAVEAFDASQKICNLTSERLGIEVRYLRFEDLCEGKHPENDQRNNEFKENRLPDFEKNILTHFKESSLTEEIFRDESFDAIWACASLLHVQSKDLPKVVGSLKNLLKPGGIIYASFKEGEKERIKEGRLFTDMTLSSCEKLFSEAGFQILESYLSQDVRKEREDETWVNVICRRTDLTFK